MRLSAEGTFLRGSDGNIIEGNEDGDVIWQANVRAITLTTPNGAEEWEAGAQHEITWASEGNIETVARTLSF